MTRAGLKLLAGDPDTRVIVVISKPPDPRVADAVEAAAVATGKPVVLALLGARYEGTGEVPRIERASTLTDAALLAIETAGGPLIAAGGGLRRPPAPGRGARPLQRRDAVHRGGGDRRPASSRTSATTSTREGRAHPMIDPSLRIEQLAAAARDPSITVLLLDVVLGYGAHPDPAAELAPVIEGARARDELT